MKRLALLLLVSSSIAACARPADEGVEEDVGAFQGTVSNLATLTFDTEVRAPTAEEAERLVDAQLYWLVGPFHELGGDPRLTWAQKTKGETETVETPRAEAVVHFNVKLEVAWPKATPMPATYDLVLPRRVDSESQQTFFDKYKDKCIATGDPDTDWSNAWYEFKPGRDACKLDEADVVRPKANVEKAQDNTTDTYPEYDRIWQDKKFQAVVVFGRDKADSTSDSDLGAGEFKKYVDALKAQPGLSDVKAKEEDFEDNGKTNKQATIDAKLAGDRTAHVVVFLLAKPSLSGDAFVQRYDPETEEADFIAFAGHAGLGGNIQKLQSLGKHKAGQYQLFVYDGCDTFAYIDRSLFDKKRTANGAEDPNGTRDMDIILNALPAPWTTGDPSVLKLTRSLLDDAKPTSFEKALELFPKSGAPVVVGDEDNRFRPR
jgi:hypothetical protein